MVEIAGRVDAGGQWRRWWRIGIRIGPRIRDRDKVDQIRSGSLRGMLVRTS